MKKDIEKALKEFLMDMRTTGEERKKGIPLITFVYREEDKAVLLRALPLPVADIQPEKRAFAGKKLLYRADYFREGKARVSFGILPVIRKPAPFLVLLENAVKGGDRKAGYLSLCNYLKLHHALCGLEALAERELSYAVRMLENTAAEEGKVKKMQDANAAYYQEVLSYVQMSRDILNACPADVPFPPFPDRSTFMAGWYREGLKGSL